MAAELDESTRRVIEAFDRLSGRLSTEEEKREESARKAYEKMMGLANATGAVADVFITFNKEIYNGKSANQAASASIHKMSDAVKVATGAFLLFAPGGIIIKGVVAALGLLTSKLIESGTLVSDQAEEVYKAYQQLAKTGATGAGAIQDVFDGLQKVGLGTEKFAAYIKLVTDNAEDLAMFGNTVNKGRKIFENTMESFSENQRMQMELLVGGREEQAAATMGYIKQQRLLTAGTKSQMDTSSAAVERYLKETDALTRVTGLNREQQQKILDEAMSEDIFSSFLDSVRDGSKEGEEQAKRIQAAIIMETTLYGKESAKGLRDSLTGFLGTSKENEKFFMTYGEGGRQLINTLRNANATQADVLAGFQAQAKSGVRLNNQMNAITQMGVASDTFIKNSERRLAKLVDSKDLGKIYSASVKELEDQLKDPAALAQAKAENDARQTQLDNQRKLNLLMPAYIEGLDKATGANREAMDSLTNAAIKAAEALGIIGGGKTVKKTEAVTAAEKATDKERAAAKPLKERVDVLAKQLGEDEKTLAEAKRAGKSLEEMRPLEERIQKAKEEHAKAVEDELVQENKIKGLALKEREIRQGKVGELGKINRFQKQVDMEKARLDSLNEKRYNLEMALEKPGTDPYYRTPQQLEAGRKTLEELKESIAKTQKSLAQQQSELGDMKKNFSPATSGVTSTSTDYLKKLAATESGMLGRTAQPPIDKKTGERASTASGLFQFTEGTWKDTTKAMGKQYSLEDRFDPQKSKEVAAYFTEQNKKQLTKSMGSDFQPTDTDLYMAHFLGAGGASSFLKAMKENPGKNAADVAEGEQVVANPNIFFEGFKSHKETPMNTLRKRTLAEVYEMMDKKLGNSAQQIAQGKAHQDVLKLAGGGIVRASSGGTSALLAEGGLNEAVVPLPDGKSIPLKMADNAGVSDKILAVAQVLNPTTRILASIWQAWNSTKTETKADDSGSKNKLVPFDTPAPDNTNIKTAMKEALFESNVEVISKLNELISVQKGTNSISEKMLRYAQN